MNGRFDLPLHECCLEDGTCDEAHGHVTDQESLGLALVLGRTPDIGDDPRSRASGPMGIKELEIVPYAAHSG